MRIGIPKEIKNREHRVAITPKGVSQLVACGHCVLMEIDAGKDSGFPDDTYRQAGASIVSRQDAWLCELALM